MQRLRELDGAMTFVLVTLALTLASALLCVPAAGATEPGAGAMLRASVIYVAVVGWQPLVAFAIARRWFKDERPFDDGIRAVALRDSLFSIVIAGFVLAVAVATETFLSHHVGIQPSQVSVDVAWTASIRLLVAFVGIIAILWLQAVIEELAWRSYVLPRLMRTLGPWPGLIAHGLLWGLCYSPLFAVHGASVWQALGYVVTCGLLGVLLGWLRLAARSIYASAASNATLTICAGLPMLLIGGGSQFSAAFEPPGWLPMLAVIVLILLHRRWRRAITIPWRRLPEHVN
jgi:membrane protease YdiL (CAAX protease family)